MSTPTLKWGIYNKNLAFSASIGPSYEITVVGVMLPLPLTMATLSSEIFAEDDGLNTQREGLLRYRVAVAVAESLGDRGLRMADRYERRAERIERELEGALDNLVTADRRAVGRGVRVLDL